MKVFLMGKFYDFLIRMQICHFGFSEQLTSPGDRMIKRKGCSFMKQTRSRSSLRRTLIKSLPLWIMAIPGIAYLIANNYMPMFGLVIAFKKINYSIGILRSPWNGVSNFVYLFKTRDAAIFFRNTILYNLVFIVLGTVMSLAVAILLSEVKSTKMRQVYQTSILIPYLLSSVMVSYVVYSLLSTDTGLFNHFRTALGLKGLGWYSTPKYWPFILTAVYLWKGFGYSSIIYFATILGIDRSMYEAASVDGATGFKKLIYITLPCLKPTIITLTLLSLSRIFNSDFGLFYQVPMNNGILFDVTNTIDTYVYRALLQMNDPGRSAAAGFLQSILGFIIVMSANWLTRRIERENALF